MRKLIALLFLFITVAYSFGQKMYEVEGTICPLMFILEDEDQYITYEPNDSIMVLDFLNGLEQKQIEKLKGVVMMQVMIDTGNNICCVSYTNKSTISNRKLDIPNRIVQMPGWKRSATGLEKTNICALVSIVFDKYEYQIKHMGYNRNRGKQLLESKYYLRKPDSTIIRNN